MERYAHHTVQRITNGSKAIIYATLAQPCPAHHATKRQAVCLGLFLALESMSY